MLDSDKIEQRINRDKKIIINNILSVFEEKPQAIILCGGYGRNEGAWYEDSEGNVCPYNDYDIAIITEFPFSRDTYKSLRRKIAEEIGIRWIDIDCYTKKQISKFKSTIHNIDLYEGSTLLWGNPEWSKTQKFLDPKKIGIDDLITLYRTRMWTLLGSWQGEFNDIEGEDARFFRNQMAKCILASCDMRLIKLKKYTSSYRKRVELITKEFSEDQNLSELSRWAIKEKLNPSSDRLSKNEMKRLYNEAYKEFERSFQYAIGKKAKYYLSPALTDSYIKKYTLHYAHVLYGRFKGMRNLLSKSHDIFIAQNYVLRAFDFSENYNLEYIERASNLLKKWGYIAQQETDWNRLRTIVAEARNTL